MPFYDVRCDCGFGFEVMQSMNEEHAPIECEMCLGIITRKTHRDGFSVPMIQGETVAGGNMYEGYDEGLGEYVKSKSHRKDLMDKKGLEEYTPDPEMKKHREEAKYIRRRSKATDPDAVAAINREYKTALDKRRNRNIEKSLDKSLSSVSAD